MSPGLTTADAAAIVSFEDVSKVYGGVRAVDELSLELWPRQTVALLGPNGAGTSTSLDMLLALRKPTSGWIRMFGSYPYHAVKSGRVGAMLQSGGLMPEVTVRELVTLVTGFHPRPLPVDQTLRRAGITGIASRGVDKLSGGQTQRVRFALAIVGDSDLIVLDEPTTAMDVKTRQAFWANMNAEVAGGRTLLFATHYLEEADQAANRILVINQGRLLADGTPAQIKAWAGAKRISFGLNPLTRRPCGLPGLVAWSPCVHLEIRHDLVQIQSADSDRTLYAHCSNAAAAATGIEVPSLGLEQRTASSRSRSRWCFPGGSPQPGSPPRRGAATQAAYASIGAFSGALTGNAQRISQERKDGWIRQLRLTSLPANAYVLAKVIASMVTTIPAVAIVLVLGRCYGGVHLAPGSGWPSRASSGSARSPSPRWRSATGSPRTRSSPWPCWCTSSCRSWAGCGSRWPAGCRGSARGCPPTRSPGSVPT